MATPEQIRSAANSILSQGGTLADVLAVASRVGIPLADIAAAYGTTTGQASQYLADNGVTMAQGRGLTDSELTNGRDWVNKTFGTNFQFNGDWQYQPSMDGALRQVLDKARSIGYGTDQAMAQLLGSGVTPQMVAAWRSTFEPGAQVTAQLDGPAPNIQPSNVNTPMPPAAAAPVAPPAAEPTVQVQAPAAPAGQTAPRARHQWPHWGMQAHGDGRPNHRAWMDQRGTGRGDEWSRVFSSPLSAAAPQRGAQFAPAGNLPVTVDVGAAAPLPAQAGPVGGQRRQGRPGGISWNSIDNWSF